MFAQEDKNSIEIDDIPYDYICPITQDLMEYPVVAADGFSYEESAIIEWIKRGGRNSPVTGEKLANLNLTPNHKLRSIINEFKERSPKIKQKNLDLEKRLQQLEQQITDLKQQPKYYVASQDFLSYQNLPQESKNSEFLSAALHGEVGRLIGLFEAGADIEAFREKDKRTALHLAAFKNQRDAMEYLLTRGANTKTRDKRGRTPLILAAKKADFNITEQLLRSCPDDVSITDDKGKTALYYAVKYNKKTAYETVQVLLNAGADFGTDSCWEDCLSIAHQEDKQEIAKSLLNKHMKFFYDDIIGKETKKFQVLFTQLRSSIDTQGIPLLINTLEQFDQIRTFLQENILSQATERIRLLCTLGTSTYASQIQPFLTQAETVQQNLFYWWEKTLYEEHCQQFNNLLLLAASSSSLVFEQLLNFVQSVYSTILTDVQLQNLLQVAIENDELEIVKSLLEIISKLNWREIRAILLEEIARSGVITQMMIESRGERKKKPSQQALDKLLLQAAKYGRSDLIKTLLQKAATIYAEHIPDTPLFQAMKNKHDDAVKILLNEELKLLANGKTGQVRPSYYLLQNAAIQRDFDAMNMILQAYGYDNINCITDIKTKFPDMDSAGIHAINDAILENRFTHFQTQQRDILQARRYKLNRLLIISIEVQEEQTVVYLLKRGADPREALKYAKANELNDFVTLLSEWKQELGQKEIIEKLTFDSDFKGIFSLCPHTGEIVIEKKLHELNLRTSDVNDIREGLEKMLQLAIEIKASDNIFRIQMAIEFITELGKYLKDRQSTMISSPRKHRKGKQPAKDTYSDISSKLRANPFPRRRSATFTSSSLPIASPIKQEIRADKKQLEKILKAIKNHDIEGLKVLLVKITYLDLSGYMIGSAGANVLAEALKYNSSIITLDLTTNEIDADDFRTILKAINANKLSALISIILANNLLGPNIQKFAVPLWENRKLKYVSLTDTKIDDKGALAIADIIENNPTLTSLSLRYNTFSDYGAKIIATALFKNNTLTSLDLSGTRISADFIKSTINPFLERNKNYTTDLTQSHEIPTPSTPPL